jgi:transglutaminase-like putative cysteine protease
MRISVSHSTLYRYENPVYLDPHVLRLRPRDNGTQRLLNYDLALSPLPAGQSEGQDEEGNVVLHVWYDAPLGQLAVRSSFEVETLRTNPFDFMLADAELSALPLNYPKPLSGRLAHYTAGQDLPVAVRDFAGAVAADGGWRTMNFLMALNLTLFDTCRHVIRANGPPQPSEVTLQLREGSCRDLAVVFCDACRAVGIAARFVSGYERAAAVHEHAYMHAWAEVFLPGGGWRGYDPSRGLAVSTSHVAVAAAADPELAAPISGSFRGSVRSHMEVSISMEAVARP